MAEIGKSLVFYLKYYPEMTRLFEERRAIPGIEPRADSNLGKRIEAVGNAACDEAADLLNECIADLVDRLQASNLVKLKQQLRSTIRKNWGLEIDVWLARKREPRHAIRQIGIHLHREGLIPWVWSRGGLAAEERIMSYFPKGLKCYGSAKFPEWMGGSVSLEKIRVPWEEASDDFTLNADKVIAKARKVFETIDPAIVKKLIALRL
jgi:hypothetical protein